ncbi:hypothetical protein CIW54_28070 (plasmid) [Paraburkholderia sp. T12-10]|nr:hypothetical protein CIW54_28070 [Paraburkholderia sp. T12-10]
MGIFGFGDKNKRTLESLKRRAKVGCSLTMITNNMNGNNMPIPDPILNIKRRILLVHPHGLGFDPTGPGGERRCVFLWPVRRPEGFAGLLQNEQGFFLGFIDDDTFVVDYSVYYSVFRLDT